MMHKYLMMVATLLLLSSGQAFTAEVAPQSPSGSLNYWCDDYPLPTCHCYGRVDCTNMLSKADCHPPDGLPPWEKGDSSPPYSNLDWRDYVNCDFATGMCTCNANPSHYVRTTDGIVATRASPNKLERKSSKDYVVDHRKKTAIKTGAIAPNNRTGTTGAAAKNTSDHRKKSNTSFTDHRKKSNTNFTDHRKKSNTNFTDHRIETSNEPSKEIPKSSGLIAPSGLVVSRITRTSLTLSWVDNSNREFGVELYRADPVVARRNRANSWKKIGTFEERNQSNVTGTGMRSDEDFDLSPGTNYCYRMRTYSGFDRSEVSDYSEVVCTITRQ